MTTIYFATVREQRDNTEGGKFKKPDLRGQYVNDGGFTTEFKKATFFTSLGALRGRIPLFWAFNVHAFHSEGSSPALKTPEWIKKVGHHEYEER